MRTKLQRRDGAINPAPLAAIGSILLLGGLIAMLVFSYRVTSVRTVATTTPAGVTVEVGQPLVVFCAASVKAPIEAATRRYETEYGVQVQLQFGASQTLLTNIEVSGAADLYIPADEYYVDLARTKKLVREAIPLATMKPVVAVKKGNPRNIQTLDDILSGDLKIAQAEPDATAIGKLTRDVLTPLDKWEPLKTKTTVFKGTVNDVANDLKVGAVDVGFVWDVTVRQYPDLEAVTLSEFGDRVGSLSVTVVEKSKQPTAALKLARYLTARDRGLEQIAAAGFQPAAGDVWVESPELKLFAGSMLRPAIEETVKLFEQREGVSVTRAYNGCGILVGQMKTGSIPDAYFACDKEFMTQVKDHFPSPVDVANNQLVILVKKGNPFQIATLKDLGKEGLRVGIGHEKQCAMGWLTQKTFEESGVKTLVMKNVKVQTPTGDMLVNQLRTDSLDAAVAYLSNAVNSGDFLDAIKIENVPCSVAVQPFGVAKQSEQKQLTARLLETIRSAESQERFLTNGFGWGTVTPQSEASPREKPARNE